MSQQDLQIVLDNLSGAFKKPEQDELYTKFLAFLASNENSNYVTILTHVLNTRKDLFKSTALQLASDAEKLIDNSGFRNIMYEIWQNYFCDTDTSHKNFKKDVDHYLDVVINNKHVLSTFEYNLLRSFSYLPASDLNRVISSIENIANSVGSITGAIVSSHIEKSVSLLKSGSGKIVTVTLVCAFLAWDIYLSIKSWWKGEITGKRCMKKIVDSASGVAGGLAGGMAGMAVGGFLGPVGLVLGGVFGTFLGSECAAIVSDWITAKLFDLPKSVALENAYNFLGVHHSTSTIDLNKRFRELCLIYHPDKGGKAEDFHKLQYAWAVIKASKE